MRRAGALPIVLPDEAPDGREILLSELDRARFEKGDRPYLEMHGNCVTFYADPLPEATGPVDWLAGASMMLREEVIRTVGIFDETFFLYFEETDLCRRAAEAGWPTHFVKESRVEHIGSVSTGMKTWKRVPGYWFDSRWHYFRKSGGTSRAVAATLAHVAGALILRARRLVQPKIPSGPPHFLRDLMSHAFKSLFRKKHVDGP
jgi:GT2 family glycosyltransferase